MNEIPFYKMSGSGNDFILIDNRQGIIGMDDPPAFVAKVCRRAMSVGADGLILIEASAQADFRWRFFNSDGSLPEMCGNGARCAARFAFLNGIAGADLAFETLAGLIEAHVEDDQVRIKMSDPSDLVLDDAIVMADYPLPISHVNTGVPHVVMQVKDLAAANVTAIGHDIRFHPKFQPEGTNVNFIAPTDDGPWAIRTYERGVEGETLACGTGAVAAALVLALRYDLASPVILKTRSGSLLKSYFRRQGERFDQVCLEGDARVVYQGLLTPEAWAY
ncbi:MAG: diaminopimelate epimerase [Desulfatitalea sp.]|nr:diaminopimelate epimerase [Desulfatitalea sp.]NNK02430.1 diaminopimelate epimerase [Desulfatitalea sp.]